MALPLRLVRAAPPRTRRRHRRDRVFAGAHPVGSAGPSPAGLLRPGRWRICWFGFAGTTLALAILALIVLRNRPRTLASARWGLGRGGAERPGGGRPPLGQSLSAGVMWHVGLIYVAFGFSYIIYMTFFTKYLVAEAHYTPAAAAGCS